MCSSPVGFHRSGRCPGPCWCGYRWCWGCVGGFFGRGWWWRWWSAPATWAATRWRPFHFQTPGWHFLPGKETFVINISAGIIQIRWVLNKLRQGETKTKNKSKYVISKEKNTKEYICNAELNFINVTADSFCTFIHLYLIFLYKLCASLYNCNYATQRRRL